MKHFRAGAVLAAVLLFTGCSNPVEVPVESETIAESGPTPRYGGGSITFSGG